MKFRKSKEETPEEATACKSCQARPGGLPISKEEALKQLKEMEKRKAPVTPCPYLETCDQKMLLEIGRMICLDEEIGGRQGQAFVIHLNGHHVWESCRKYVEILREDRGVLPKDLKKALKAKAK